MASSVNTNVGAMVALQNLNKTNSDLMVTQSRINTGLKVANAKDNAAIWAIAQNQRATSSSLNSVISSLQRGQSTVDVAMSAGESVSDLLVQMKDKALAAADTTLDTASRTSLNDEFMSLRDQITKVVANADFNGSNMLKSGGATVMALANASATSQITVAAQALVLGQSGTALASLTATATINTQASASAMIATINTAIANVSTALSKLGTGSKALATHLTFIGKLQDTLDAGIGNLVDADLAKESAKLQALQTKQQLGIQALVDREPVFVDPARPVPIGQTAAADGRRFIRRSPPFPPQYRSVGARSAFDRSDAEQHWYCRRHIRSPLRPDAGASPDRRRHGFRAHRAHRAASGSSPGDRGGQGHRILRLQDRQPCDRRGRPAAAEGRCPEAPGRRPATSPATWSAPRSDTAHSLTELDARSSTAPGNRRRRTSLGR